MAVETEFVLSAITPAEVGRVAQFLHDHLNDRLTAPQWAAAMIAPWPGPAPNHGFMLTREAEVVGVSLAFYAERVVDGSTEQFCNMAALAVREDCRAYTFRLVRALLAQRAYHFTDLSPSGNVVELDRRLGFRPLDVRTALTPNLPWPAASGVRLIVDLEEIERQIRGIDAVTFRDHRSALAARHLLLVRGDEQCYLVYRRDRRRRLPLFASILHVGNPDLYRAGSGLVAWHLLRRGALATLVELRLLGLRPPPRSRLLSGRPKMVRSKTLADHHFDNLYSELTCVPW